MLKRLGKVLVGIQLLNTTPQQTEQVSPPDSLLPDVMVLEPKELYINNESGVKKLRFDTTMVNNGLGKLEFIGNSDTERKITQDSKFTGI